jgi:hypothetical protein
LYVAITYTAHNSPLALADTGRSTRVLVLVLHNLAMLCFGLGIAGCGARLTSAITGTAGVVVPIINNLGMVLVWVARGVVRAPEYNQLLSSFQDLSKPHGSVDGLFSCPG